MGKRGRKRSESAAEPTGAIAAAAQPAMTHHPASREPETSPLCRREKRKDILCTSHSRSGSISKCRWLPTPTNRELSVAQPPRSGIIGPSVKDLCSTWSAGSGEYAWWIAHRRKVTWGQARAFSGTLKAHDGNCARQRRSFSAWRVTSARCFPLRKSHNALQSERLAVGIHASRSSLSFASPAYLETRSRAARPPKMPRSPFVRRPSNRHLSKPGINDSAVPEEGKVRVWRARERAIQVSGGPSRRLGTKVSRSQRSAFRQIVKTQKKTTLNIWTKKWKSFNVPSNFSWEKLSSLDYYTFGRRQLASSTQILVGQFHTKVIPEYCKKIIFSVTH